MSKTSRNIIAIAIVILFISIALLYSISNAGSMLVPEYSVGATAGNLYNEGLFVESDGLVYFSNSYDEGAIYSMNPDQTDIKKVYNLRAKYLNASGDFLFFFGDTISTSTGLGSVVSKPGIYQLKKDGKKLKALTKDVAGVILSFGNTILYQSKGIGNGSYLSAYDLKSGEKKLIAEEMIIPGCISDGLLFYNGAKENHHLYTLNPSTYEMNDIWNGSLWNPIKSGDYIYYMDIENNYRLARYSLSGNYIEILTNDRVDFFNVYGDVVFYQFSNPSNPALKRINTDGSDETVIAEGIYNKINVTSSYTYFKKFGDDYSTYYTPTYGMPNVNEFLNAKSAIMP